MSFLPTWPGAPPGLEAECHEGLRDYRRAADTYLQAGQPRDALRCYRSIPDPEAALALLAGLPDHPAAGSLLWLKKIQELVAQRPEEFFKVMLPAEKAYLQQLLETGLGVTKKKRAAPSTSGPRTRGRPPKAQSAGATGR